MALEWELDVRKNGGNQVWFNFQSKMLRKRYCNQTRPRNARGITVEKPSKVVERPKWGMEPIKMISNNLTRALWFPDLPWLALFWHLKRPIPQGSSSLGLSIFSRSGVCGMLGFCLGDVLSNLLVFKPIPRISSFSGFGSQQRPTFEGPFEPQGVKNL